MSGSDRRAAAAFAAALRSESGRVVHWLLLGGNRWTIAGVVAAAFLALFVGLELVLGVSTDNLQPMYYLFSAIVTGNLTLITVVVSINQLLLSREFMSPGELQEQIEHVTDYRDEVESAAGAIAPPYPLDFLGLLFRTTREELQRLDDTVHRQGDAAAYEDVDVLVGNLTDNVDRVVRLLDEPHASTFSVVESTLTTNYAEQIHRARRLRQIHGGDLPPEAARTLDDLIQRLREIDVARQYFKNIYLEEELSQLSRSLFYTGIPAEAAAAAALFTFATNEGRFVGEPVVLIVLPLLATIGFLPLAVLFSVILRTATVTQRTVAIIPFTTSSQEL